MAHKETAAKRSDWSAWMRTSVELAEVMESQLKLQRALVHSLGQKIVNGFGYKALENGDLDPDWAKQVVAASGSLARLATEYRKAQEAGHKAQTNMTLDQKVEKTAQFVAQLDDGMRLMFLSSLLDDPEVRSQLQTIMDI